MNLKPQHASTQNAIHQDSKMLRDLSQRHLRARNIMLAFSTPVFHWPPVSQPTAMHH